MKRTILLITALLMLLAIGCGSTEPKTETDPNAVYIDPNAVRGGEYGDLYFEADGVRFGIYDEAEPVLSALSGKVGEHTSESCAFDHADVAHFYPSFEITTNEIDGVARITAIRLTTDMVETPQGLKIGMREEDAANAFPALKDADWNLADGTALLSVTIVDGKVAEIVYTPSISED
jgi:hypothetical protein